MAIFERKIYRKMLDWKNESQGKSALLIEGARRIGKSTIVKEFAKKEYKSYILIDFNIAGSKIFSSCIDTPYLIYTKDLRRDASVVLLPAYLTQLLK